MLLAHANENLINNYDYGRQIQAALFTWGDGGVPSRCGTNPTEAGDAYSGRCCPPAGKQNPPYCPGPPPCNDANFPCLKAQQANRHGSPLLSITTDTTTDPAHPTQSTRAIPLDFDPNGSISCRGINLGGTADNPVLWQDMRLGKDLTLNYNNLGRVVQYNTVMQLPRALNTGDATIEDPAVFLRAIFTEIYVYDPKATPPTLNPGSPTCGQSKLAAISGTEFKVEPAAGKGLIAASADGLTAFGLYAPNNSITRLVAVKVWSSCPVLGGPSDTGEFDFSTTLLAAQTESPFSLNSSFTTYLMSGSLQEVQQKMRSLCLATGACP